MHRFMGKSGLTRFMTDFADGMCIEVKERSSDTIAGITSIIREEIVAYLIKDDNGNNYTIFIKISYTLSSKYWLIVPQWLGIQDNE